MVNAKIIYAILILTASAMLAGCVQTPLIYQWGGYEEIVYAMYSDPGKIPIEKQIEYLEQNYQKARAANKPVPPGYHAHIGFLYFQLGKIDQALQSFETEKGLFPESAVYMDRLIARIKQ